MLIKLCLIVFLLNIQSAVGQNLLIQDFNFTGNITANGWITHSGSTNPITTTSGLIFADYAGSNIGNAAQIGNAGGEDDNISFTSQNTNGQSIYVAFMANINDTSNTKNGDYFFHLGNSTGTNMTVFSARVFAKIVAGNVNFGLSNTTTVTYGTNSFSKNTTYLLVIKYTINNAPLGNDTTSLWVIPSGVPASELLAGTPEVTNTTTTGSDIINAVALRQGSATASPKIIVDGVRIGLTWSNAVQSVANPNTPTIISFTPTSGTSGATITITGTNFTGATVVTIGGVAVTTYTVVNATTITATVASGATGAVSVTTPSGTASLAGFTYIAPSPTITSFTPTSGAIGTTVTITGTNLTGATAVSIGGVTVTSYTVVNATTITAIVANGASGSVSVTTPNGTATLTGFTFIANAPTITSFTPTYGTSGSTITITGTNLTGATAVSFGGVAAASYTVLNATTITAVLSTGASGSVSVTTPNGTATLAGFVYCSGTYNAFTSDTLKICGDSTILNAGAGYTSYIWNTGATSQNLTVKNNGWYKVTVSLASCGGTDSVYVSITKSNIIQSNSIICKGSSITLSIETNFASPSTQLWSTNAVSTSINVSPSTATTYYCKVRNNIHSCVDSVLISVSSVDTSVTFTRPTTFCAGDSVVLRAAANTNYQWMLNGINIPGATSQNYTASQSGSYRVALRNAQSCVDTSRSITVTVNPAPAEPTVNTPLVYCLNVTASPLEATGSNLLWYTAATGGTGSSSIPTPSTTTAGNAGYYVTQTENGCESPRALIEVTINSLPNVPTVTTPVEYCQDATATALTATGTSILWYSTAIGGIGDATAPTPITTAAGSTTYYVSQNNGNCEGPRASIIVTISPFSAPPTVISPVVYCQDAIANALTATGTNLFWYESSTGGVGDPIAPTPETTTPGNTTYYVGQSAVGSCPGSRAEIVVTVNPAPQNEPIVTTPIHFCQGTNATQLTATGNGLLWFTVASGGSGSSSAPTPSTGSANNTTYYVCESIGTCEGPRAALVVSIDPAGVPVFDPINSICIGGTTPTLQTVSLNGIPGFWTPSTISNTITQLHTFTPTLGAGTCAATTTMLISVFPNPYKNTRYTSINALQGKDMQLQARKVDSPSVYLWTPGAGLNNINIANPIYNFGREVEYIINITTKEGCKITDTLFVRIFKQVEIFVPGGFSPNGDGKNDVLIPEPVGIKEFHYFKVFDRWGQLVYQTSERGKGWNGFFKGQKQPMETYMWIAEGVDIYGKIVKRSGSTILLK